MPLPDDSQLALTPAERAKATVLIVESEPNDRNNMRNALKSLGYGGFSDVPSHAAAFEKVQDRKFTHVIFEAKKTNMPAKDFLHQMLEQFPSIIAIPSSYEPSVDDVFDLLIMGAKGYLVKPFTADTLEDAIVNATKGEPMSPAVLNAKDRNEALVAILMASLDKAATTMRQALQFETARREVPRMVRNMKRSAELAKTFCKGGDEGMLDALEKFCIERSKGPATRLGRLRKRLKTTRAVDEPEDGQEAEATGS
ncbi:MAG: response regulator [Bdellovibrionota bacterium]|nr:MAG: response regulator [Bdellovibrionota bacterium]